MRRVCNSNLIEALEKCRDISDFLAKKCRSAIAIINVLELRKTGMVHSANLALTCTDAEHLNCNQDVGIVDGRSLDAILDSLEEHLLMLISQITHHCDAQFRVPLILGSIGHLDAVCAKYGLDKPKPADSPSLADLIKTVAAKQTHRRAADSPNVDVSKR